MKLPGTKGFRASSLRSVRASEVGPVCSVCDGPIAKTGGPAGFESDAVDGSFTWARGEQVNHERVPQCSECAAASALMLLRRFESEDGGG